MKCLMVVLAVLFVGCGRSAVDYDAVSDSSQVYKSIGGLKIPDRKDSDVQLSVILSGKGKHPSQWDATLHISARGAIGSPDVLGASPTLVINSRLRYSHVIAGSRFRDKDPGRRDDTVMFNMSIDELVSLIESPAPTLNGRPFPLTDGARDKIRQAIIAAREATNAGK